MTIKIKTRVDKFGRIVIPKRIRQDFGITNNSEVYLEARENGIVIHTNTSLPFVIDKGGVIVVCSEPTAEFNSFLKREREDRIKKIVKDINL